MKSTALATLKTAVATALLSAGISSTAIAGDNHSQQYIDYARVIDVVPQYKYVTVSKPHRQCETIRVPQHYQRSHRHNRHNHNRNHSHRHSRQHITHNHRRHNTHSAEFVGAVIGGAIGNKVTRSVNGNGKVAATVAGAVIGSSLARQVAEKDNRRHAQPSPQYFANHDRDHSHSNRHNGQHNHTHQHPQRTVSQRRCYTTTTTQQERRADGYNVTYSYRGQTFTTHMQNDPGQEIRVRVQVKPH